ncbi:hypothetical protein ACN38_g7953, partial [Penicillium nordicum]
SKYPRSNTHETPLYLVLTKIRFPQIYMYRNR